METLETLGKYEIRRPLGRGATGVVYEGWDPIIARRVAIKTVRLPNETDSETEDALARFRREAQAAGRLTHPNIVGVFDYGETSDLAFIVMEFVDGPPLKSLLDRHERFALPDIVRIMEDLLAGLQFSHQRGVVHRDIKPANIMLTSSGQAKITDFGIARIESSSMTQAGQVLGTPAYMSPEQFMGQVVDARTDIYSSGVMLYQLLTGDRPFEGSMSAIMHKALNTDPPSPSQISVTVPRAFDVVVRRAMARRPDDRYRTATEFAEALRAAAAGQDEPVTEAETTMVSTPRPVSSARPGVAATAPASVAPIVAPVGRSSVPIVPLAVAGLLVAMAGGGAWWFLLRPPQTGGPVITAAVTPPPAAPMPAPTSTATPVAPVAPVAPMPTPSAPPIQTSTQTSPPAPQATTVAPNQEPTAPPAASHVATPEPPQAREQLALAGVDAVRHRIAEWASGQRCAALQGDVRDSDSVLLSGFAGSSVADELHQGLAGLAPPGQVDWRVTNVNAAFCPTLEVLRQVVPGFATTGPHLGLAMADGKARLHDGEAVRVQLAMPDFASRLRVDYIVHDGSVQHLYPQLADPRNRIAADPPRAFAPGEPVALSNPAWTISEPYGTDMIIAVASSEPLFDRPRPSNAEAAAVYLRELQEAIDNARHRGVRLSGAAVTVDALPK
jgi:serine/threonine-protein kinase